MKLFFLLIKPMLYAERNSVSIGCSDKQKKLLQSNNKSIKQKSSSLTIP